MRKIFFKSMLLLCALIVGNGVMWGAEKIEGFEHATTSTTYNSTKTVTDEQSDCGIAWSIYYGSPSITSSLVGSKSCLIRYYTADAKLGYAFTTTGIKGLTNISFRAKVTNTGCKMGVWYSTDGNNWVELAKDVVLSTTDPTNRNCSYAIPNSSPANTYYIKIGMTSASTNKKDLIFDDVLFAYTPTFSVTYDKNGNDVTGTVPVDNNTYNNEASVTVLGNSGNLAKSGYSFGGWNTQDDGEGTNYTEGNTFSITSNTTLYAKWNAKEISNLSCTGTPSKISYYAGESFDATGLTVTATFNDQSQEDVTASVAWTPDPLTVGTTSVTGTYMEQTVIVNGLTTNAVPVSSVGLNKTSATLIIGKTLTLSATVSPSNATNKSVTWESDDETVATVDEDGKVTAVAEGTASITVKSVADDTKSATCTITVKDGAISLNAGGKIIFDDFTGAGNSYGSGTKTAEFTADDDNAYEWSGKDFMSSSGIQLKSSTGTITSPVVKAPYGYKLEITKNSYTIDVYIGEEKQTAVTTNTWELPNNTAFTFVGSTSNASKVTKITITALKAPVATELAITDPGTLATGGSDTFDYTATTEEDNTASWASATTDVITITNAATGAYTAAGRGTSKITLTLTPTDATKYRAVTAERTVTVTAPVVITANAVNMTYGDAAKAIGATTSIGYAGTLTYESGNTAIATVDETGKVTAVAAGTTTITISASADASHYYSAGEDVEIEVTVNAPAGRTTAKTTTPVEVTSNTLLSSSLPTGWTGDGAIWSASSSYGAVTANGTIGNSYDLKTPSINLNGNYTAASVTFQHTGNQTFSTSGTGRANACKLYVKDGDTETQLTISTMFAGNNWTYVTNTTDLTAYIGKTIQLIFRYTPSSGNQGKWEVKNFAVNATPTPTESVELNADGYATFCSEYPLDFSDYATVDYSAWSVTNANTETGEITFSQITGSIKGGQGILLKGTPNATITLNSVNSSNELSGNILVGCLAPTYVNQVTTFYALVHVDTPEAHSEFQNLGSYTGIIPTGKAYLDLTSLGAAPDRLRIVFEGNNATNIENIEVNEKAVKYVENGRILIKKNGITYDTLGRIVK